MRNVQGLDLVTGNQLGNAAEAMLLSAFGETGVVDSDGQILGFGLTQSIDDRIGGTVTQEATDHNEVAVFDQSGSFLGGNELILHYKKPP